MEGISISLRDGGSDYEREYEARVLKMVSEFKSACRYIHTGRGADCSELISRFVKRRPPFSKGKPDEFKDALAALSMRAWLDAENRGRTADPLSIHVISDDGDWDAVCQDIPAFKRTNLGTIMAQIEAQREGILVNVSRRMVLDALQGSDFEGFLASYLVHKEMQSSTFEHLFTIDDATIDGVDFDVESIKVPSVSEILACVHFSAAAIIDWRELDFMSSWQEEFRGTAELSITPDGKLQHIRIIAVNPWLQYGETEGWLRGGSGDDDELPPAYLNRRAETSHAAAAAAPPAAAAADDDDDADDY